VLWHDADVVVVDKPAGLPCHPLDPGEVDAVVHRLLGRFPEIATASPEPREGGLVHRLDTDTSGCLAVARHRAAWQALRDGFDAADKTYLAVVAGDAGALDGVVITDGIAHDRADRRRMVVDAAGQPCATAVAVVGVGQGHDGVVSLVRLGLRGGRRHQLRVHLAARGHPLVGDDLYGGPDAARVMLHAWRLTLPGRAMVTAPLPDDIRAVLDDAGIVTPT
jgi:23S rRNA pseudouridine1911/1915/1917 synthase